MVWPAMLSFTYPPAPSVLLTAITIISTVWGPMGGLAELRGTHIKYSKLWNVNSSASKEARVSSRTGMLALYMPAFLAGAVSFWVFPAADGLGFLLLRSALTLHFSKRVLEVIFVHKFSGFMAVDSMCVISLVYFAFTATSIYVRYMARALPVPKVDLTNPGVALFLIGISGNFYHHLILSRLGSKQEEKEYRIPTGGLFDLVTCPHYLFEIIEFVGIAFISQTVYNFAYTFATIAYLMGRSYATKRWYLSKFEEYPGHVKAIIPFML